MEQALKPCPFCVPGSRGAPVLSGSFFGTAAELGTKEDQWLHQVRCCCGASGPEAPSKAEAVDDWNRRAPSSETQGDVAVEPVADQLWALCYLHDWGPPEEGQQHRWEPGKNVFPEVHAFYRTWHEAAAVRADMKRPELYWIVRARSETEARLDKVREAASSIASLSERLAEVERENARLTRLVDGIDDERRGALDLCIERNKEIAELRAKLAEAREVIEPFARNAAAGDGTGPFEVPNGHAARFHDTDNPAKATLFEGDFRRARAFRDATSGAQS